MNDNRTDELTEKYEDAIMAMILDRYAEENGTKVLKEFEEAEKCGTIPDMPSELDNKCRNLIRHSYAKQHFHTQLKAITKTAGRVASIALAFLGLCSILIVSVEAIRTPVLDFFVTRYEKYSTITFDQDSTAPMDTTASTGSTNSKQSPLAGMIPEDYSLQHFTDKGDRGLTCMYMNNSSQSICLSISHAGGTFNIDTENAVVREIVIGGCTGLLVEKNGYSMLWKDPETQMCFLLIATALDESAFWSLAEEVAECPNWASIIFGG